MNEDNKLAVKIIIVVILALFVVVPLVGWITSFGYELFKPIITKILEWVVISFAAIFVTIIGILCLFPFITYLQYWFIGFLVISIIIFGEDVIKKLRGL